MSPTEISLLVTFRSAVVPLDEICEKYLHLSPAEARRRAGLNQLLIPTFTLNDSRKAPLLVRVSDLAAVIDSRAEESARNHAHSQL